MDFTREQGDKRLFLFLFPLLCSATFQQLYSFINTLLVSRYLHEDAVAVIGACQAWSALQSNIYVGMTTGFGVYISQLAGKDKPIFFRRGLWGAIYATAAMTLIGVIPLWCPGALARIASVPEALLPQAGKYLFWLAMGSGALGFKNLLFFTIQDRGDTVFTGVLSMVGVVTHTGIQIWLTVNTQLGVAASAAAMLFNNSLLALCFLCYLFLKYRAVCGIVLPGRISPGLYRELMCSGAAKSSMMLVMGLGTLIMQRAINSLSPSEIAAYTYADTASGIALAVLSACATAAMIAAGQTSGRQNGRLLKRYVGKLLQWDLILGFLMLGLWIMAAPAILGLLSGSGADSTVLLTGAACLRIMGFGYPGLCYLIVLRGALHGMGKYRYLPWLGAMEALLNAGMSLLVPWVGLTAVCAAVPVKWTVPGILAFLWYRREVRTFQDREKKAPAPCKKLP